VDGKSQISLLLKAYSIFQLLFHIRICSEIEKTTPQDFREITMVQQ
jgi:hypothetical protein